MKLNIPAYAMKIGDVVGSGETIVDVVLASIHFPSSKIMVTLEKQDKVNPNLVKRRTSYWGKHTGIWVDRNVEVVK